MSAYAVNTARNKLRNARAALESAIDAVDEATEALDAALSPVIPNSGTTEDRIAGVVIGDTATPFRLDEDEDEEGDDGNA